MGRSRYKVIEPTYPHFVTCTILHWLPIFTRKESVQIVIDCLKFLQEKDNLKLYAYVVLENHVAVHWRYSSARDYEGMNGLIEIERFW